MNSRSLSYNTLYNPNLFCTLWLGQKNLHKIFNFGAKKTCWAIIFSRFFFERVGLRQKNGFRENADPLILSSVVSADFTESII